MDLDQLLTLAPDEQLLRLRGEPAGTENLWSRKEAFALLFRHAVQVTLGPSSRSDVQVAPRAFLDTTYLLLLASPTDVVGLASTLPEDLAVSFLKDFVRSPLARNDAVAGLARQPDLFARLPADGGWVEVVVLVHGMGVLNSDVGRQFTIDDLIPLGVEVERSASRAVLSSAFDNNQLSPSEHTRLLRLFPADVHFRRVVGGAPSAPNASVQAFMAVYEREASMKDNTWRFLSVAETVWRQLLAGGFDPESALLSKKLPLPVLRTLSEHPDARIRGMVASKRAAAPLLALLASDHSIEVRLAVVWNPKIVPSLLRLLADDGEGSVRAAASHRLRTLAGSPSGNP